METAIPAFTGCIIVPCYNEENRLNVERFRQYAEANPNILLCFVNDGSTDGTSALLRKEFTLPNIRVLDLEKNGGKAEAVRQGVLANRNCSVIGYFDADLATPPEEFNRLSTKLNERFSFVFGSRILTVNTTIKRKALRHYSGRIIATFISLILRLPIYDTQCGAKVFKSEMTDTLFTDRFISPWLFDVELFARMIAAHGRENTQAFIKEVPLKKWTEMGDSRITFLDMLKIPFQLLRIKMAYR